MISTLTAKLIHLGIFPNSPQGRVAQLMLCGVPADCARFFGDADEVLDDEAFEALCWRVNGQPDQAQN